MTNDNTSLLAHLAGRLTTRPETLATEALGYILTNSSAARQALQRTLRTGGAEVGPITRVETEETGEQGERVDLAGFDEHGSERVLIEAKFWASLTENQPNTYLERLLNDGKPAVLLFVAPRARLETLWSEIRRTANKRFNLGEDSETQGVKSTVVDESERRLMLTSWQTLLDSMLDHASSDGDSSTERDIRQLNALCRQQDSADFLPLRSEELGPEFPRRMLNLHQLIQDAMAIGHKDGFVQGNTAGTKDCGYGRYIWLGNGDTWAYARFGVDYDHWSEEEETPLWLEFETRNESTRDIPNKVNYDYAPFRLPTGVSYDAVLKSVVDELREIAEDVSGTAAKDSAP